MAFVIWLALGALCTYALRRHLDVLVAILFALRLFIPHLAGSSIIGPGTGMDPAAWWCVVALVVLVFFRPRVLRNELVGMFGPYGMTIFLLAITLTSTSLLRSRGDILGFANTVGTGIVLLFLFRSAIRDRPKSVARFMTILVSLCTIEAVISLAQWISGKSLFYESLRQSADGNERSAYQLRSVGTLDSPLDLAFFLVVMFPLVLQMRMRWLRLPVAVLIATGVLLTQSRSGLVVLVALVVLMLVRAQLPLLAKAGLAIVAAGLGALVLNSSIAFGTLSRFVDDKGSDLTRKRANDYFFSNLSDIPATGYGYGASLDLKTNGTLQSSLENGYAMFAFDFGLFALIILGVIVFRFALVGIKRGRSIEYRLPGLAAVVLAATYSGVMTQSAASWVFWLAIAIASTSNVSVTLLSKNQTFNAHIGQTDRRSSEMGC